MEGEIGLHDKFVYCRFKGECKKGTLKQNVKILRAAKASKAAPKDTPKSAKGMHGGNYRFKNGCAYDHQKPTIN